MIGDLVDAARCAPAPTPLACRCGGNVRLDGWAKPNVSVRYMCVACKAVVTSLSALVPRPQ